MAEAFNLIAGRRRPIAGTALRSHNPAHPERTVWEGSPRVEHVEEAVRAARAAFREWSRWPIEQRAAALMAYKGLCEKRACEIAHLLCDETGKALWEAEAEAKLMASKVETTLLDGPMSAGSGRARITPFEIPLGVTRIGRCAFRGHGVMGVLGPFNFPAHLPNGHMVPALLAGNTVVFKPSDKTPAVGQMLAEMLHEALESAGAPAGVVNLVQGGADIASALVNHDGIDGILFTGSWPVGRRILEANLDRPGRIVALELGGNNAAVVLDDADLRLAAVECARAAFATTGQRCTCTRRIVVQEGIADRFIDVLTKIARNLVIGDPRRNPFMGPVIRAEAREAALAAQRGWIARGGEVLLEARAIEDGPGGHYVSAGVVRVPRFEVNESACGGDVEVFGPIVRVATVRTVDEAVEQANATRFGLAASIFTRKARSAERFLAEARAGCVNVNTGTAGASGKLPFGGIGLSGNHRPAGSFALDYCAYPVASMIETGTEAALSPGMRVDEEWF
jgi:succinylglutamic semialdehyde dehydrogenase